MYPIVTRLFGIIRFLADQVYAKINPNGYVRSLRVKVGENVCFYAIRPGMFNTEPWLITIGDNVHITYGVVFVTHDGGTLVLRKEVPDLEWTAPIIVGNDVYIGYRAMILPGVTIGDRCIIGAGAVVTKPIPSGSVSAGVPTCVIKSTDEYLAQMQKKSLKCDHLKGKDKERVLRRMFQHDR